MADTDANLERYLELKTQIAELQAEMDGLQDSVFGLVEKAGGKLEDDRFTASTQKRPKYKFSDAYEAQNTELKNLRKKEIDEGIATVESYSEFVTLRLRTKKDKKE